MMPEGLLIPQMRGAALKEGGGGGRCRIKAAYSIAGSWRKAPFSTSTGGGG